MLYFSAYAIVLISMLKLILKLCCSYRTGLTLHYTNARTVDLKDGDF